MKNKSQIIAIFLSVTFSVLVISLVVYGATTIGNNITTGGVLTADTASTSNDFWLGNETADDDDYLFMDASSSEYIMWDDDPGNFAFSDDLKVTGVATGTVALWAGSAGTPTEVDLTGGDLYVQGDAEIDGSLFADSATTTDTFSIGAGIAIREFNWGTCDFADASVTASSTAHVWCLNATGVTSADSIFVTATSSFETNYIIQTASSTSEAGDQISMRVLNTGMNTGQAEDTTLGGTTLNWQAIR